VLLTDRSTSIGGETYSDAFDTVSEFEDELVEAMPTDGRS